MIRRCRRWVRNPGLHYLYFITLCFFCIIYATLHDVIFNLQSRAALLIQSYFSLFHGLFFCYFRKRSNFLKPLQGRVVKKLRYLYVFFFFFHIILYLCLYYSTSAFWPHPTVLYIFIRYCKYLLLFCLHSISIY